MKAYLLLIVVVLAGCTSTEPTPSEEVILPSQDSSTEEPAVEPTYEIGTFAGGCFWCTEADFEKVPGVITAVSGFTGGTVANPSYKQAASGSTGHTEAVQVTYDPSIVSYEELVEFHWRHHDPTDGQGQFGDRGLQYRPGIFYHSEEQRKIAQASKEELDASGVFSNPVVAEITAFEVFYEAEEYHQDYYKKNPIRYKFYRTGSGRDQFLSSIWT